VLGLVDTLVTTSEKKDKDVSDKSAVEHTEKTTNDATDVYEANFLRLPMVVVNQDIPMPQPRAIDHCGQKTKSAEILGRPQSRSRIIPRCKRPSQTILVL
jgi:hypothetical protein